MLCQSDWSSEMMTRKHFEAIAHVLNANMAPHELVEDFADMLEQENPRFDRYRFVDASSKLREEYMEQVAKWSAERKARWGVHD